MTRQTRDMLTVKEFDDIANRFKNGAKVPDIAEQYGRSRSVLYRISDAVKQGKTDEWREHLLNKKANHAKTRGESSAQPKSHRTLATRAAALKRRQKIMELRSTGLSVREIAEKIGVTYGTVSYYLATQHRLGSNGNHSQKRKHLEEHEEATQNGALNGTNRNILIGVAFAETERFIGVLSERLSVPAPILRQKLSELLGHSPLR